MKTLQLFSLLLTAGFAYSQESCGFPPNVECLVQLAQYTVVGTVVSNDLNTPGTFSTASSYNAMIAIQCAYTSFSPTPSSGNGLVGSTVNVTRFGVGRSNCQRGSAKEALVNDTRIYFISVLTRNAIAGQRIDYSVVDICVGAVERTAENIQKISNIIAQYPNNAISAANRGGPACALPPPTISITPNAPGTGNLGSPPLPDSSGALVSLGFLTIAFLLTLAFI